MGRTIEEIEVVDVEKRKIPSKHYVYILHVTWSDQSTNVIYRRYSRFFDFQSKLMDMFPEEAGALDPSKRIIPFLPGKKFFGRSHIREVALKRMAPIGEYCKAIVKLPRKISQCKDVIQFFELEPDDINPPKGRKASVKAKKISQPKPLEVYITVTDYKKQEKGEVTLKVGMVVEVVEKTETGWWFVNVEDEQGWVPSTCLEREDGQKEDTTVRFGPGEEQQYLCTEEFHAEGEDEISMERGAVVDVIEKNLEGWWLVRYNGQEGFVPATFLIQTESVKVPKKAKMEIKKTEPVVEKKANSFENLNGGPQIVKSLKEVSNLLQEDSDTNATTTTTTTQPAVTLSQYESDDDVFDDDDFDEEEQEKIYTVQELSKILKEDKRGCAETEKVYESIQSMKSRSLKRYGSTRPPPRPSVRPGHGGYTPKSPKPKFLPSESSSTEYVTIAAFADAVGDGISFEMGQSVKVLEKSSSGWWYVEIDNKEGWAPAAYIEPVEPAVNKQRAPSPQATKQTASSPRRGRDNPIESEDVSKHSFKTEPGGDLASALKGKLGLGPKGPPTPPKKDFLTDDVIKEDTNTGRHSIPGKLQIPGGLLAQTGLKKVVDRSSQPPSAPSADRSKQPLPPAPPVKPANEPKSPPFTKTSKPTPPKKVDTKPENKPKPSLPGRMENKPINEKPKPSLPVKQVLEGIETRPKPPPKSMEPSKTDHATEHDIAGGNVREMTNALKAKFSALETDNSTVKPAGSKPKTPVKSNAPDKSFSDRSSNVSKLAGVMTAKFEATNTEKSFSQTHRPKTDIFTKGIKPGHNQNKPSHPETVKKPAFGCPSVPEKPSPMNQGSHTSARPSWVKNHEVPSQSTEKPSWAKNDNETTWCRKSVSHEDDSGTHKVSDLANVLKAKFESRQKVGDSSGSEITNRDSKPDIPTRSALKPFQKPARPTTPPSPKSPKGRKLPNIPPGRSSSPVSGDTKSLDPQKYSSRPLPPEPKSPSKSAAADKHSSKPLPVLPMKPKSSSPLAQLKKTDSSGSTDSEEESHPVGVSNLANALKARLAGAGARKPESSSHSLPEFNQMKPKQPVSEVNNSNSDVENNNVTSECLADGKLYCAIADFAGHGEGELELVIGQEVELLDMTDGWSFVKSGNNEGWVPSSYLEEVKTCQTKNRNMYITNTEFIAENNSELSVAAGQEVVVLDTPEGGWWYVQASGKEGWIPASYIEKI